MTGVKALTPKQSRVQGVLCLWTDSHSCFCLSGCSCAGPQTDVTEKIWTGMSPQSPDCKSGGQEESSGKKREEQ